MARFATVNVSTIKNEYVTGNEKSAAGGCIHRNATGRTNSAIATFRYNMGNRMRHSVFYSAVLLVAQPLCAQDTAVHVREVRLRVPSYDEGAPDPNPQFGALYNDIFPNYPYAIRTPSNKLRQMLEWRTIVLENQYISCRVLPDLGGHLQGCTDRIANREVFYANPAIRRGPESSRGAFIATGIESSFPVAHSRVASSPVDFGYSVQDGIGKVVVGDTDRASGMEWRVEFILREGSTVLEQRVTLHNGSAARRGYHWWANAAVELDDPHLQFVYPVKWMLPHGDGPMTPWPRNAAGVDLSDVANHKSPIGLFARASGEAWMAFISRNFAAAWCTTPIPLKCGERSSGCGEPTTRTSQRT